MQQPGCSSWGSFRKLDSASWIPQMRAVLVVTWDEIDAMTAGLAGEQVGDRGATPQGQVRRGQSADEPVRRGKSADGPVRRGKSAGASPQMSQSAGASPQMGQSAGASPQGQVRR